MKLLSSLYFIFIIVGCGENTQSNYIKPPCTLTTLIDSGGHPPYVDFTLHDVAVVKKDSKGTDWKTTTTDVYRFVVKDERGVASRNILIYKNGRLFREHLGLNLIAYREVPADRGKCELKWDQELNITSWKNNGQTLFSITWFRPNCSFSVYYQIDKETALDGEMKIQNALNCN